MKMKMKQTIRTIVRTDDTEKIALKDYGDDNHSVVPKRMTQTMKTNMEQLGEMHISELVDVAVGVMAQMKDDRGIVADVVVVVVVGVVVGAGVQYVPRVENLVNVAIAIYLKRESYATHIVWTKKKTAH